MMIMSEDKMERLEGCKELRQTANGYLDYLHMTPEGVIDALTGCNELLEHAFYLACDEIAEAYATCPAEIYRPEWDCTHCGEDITGCWHRYFMEKVVER